MFVGIDPKLNIQSICRMVVEWTGLILVVGMGKTFMMGRELC
jgi:D-arabinose 5-phosphate isomerase GutQ